MIEGGQVCEIGTHDELMENSLGRYRRLQMLQDIHTNDVAMAQLHETVTSHALTIAKDSRIKNASSKLDNVLEELDKDRVKKNTKRAWAMGAEDSGYFFVGAVGAFMAGLVFPGWGKTGLVDVASACYEIAADTSCFANRCTPKDLSLLT